VSVIIPQLDVPVRFAGNALAVVEQDTLDEIRACVEVILRTPVGSLLEQPDFGIPDQSFSLNGADPAPILAAVQQWEPRATAVAAANNQTLAQYVTSIVLDVAGGT